MNEDEEIKIRMELVRIARDVLNEEYINKRAEDHNAWLVESERAWRAGKVKVAYPAFAKYPTHADIIEKALVLYNFIKPQGPVLELESVKQPDTVVENIILQDSADVNADSDSNSVVPMKDKKTSLLPGWVRRTI